jgi:O-antigen ligase
MDLDININFLSLSKRITISRQWIVLAIVTATLLFTLIVSFWGTNRQLQLVLVMVVGFGGVLVLLRQLQLGIILVFIASMFVPFAGPGGINASVLAIAAIAGFWLIDMFVIKRKFHIIKSRAMLPIYAFLIISLLSFLMGQFPWFIFANQAPLDAQIGGFFIFILSATAFIVTAHIITEISWLEKIVWIFIGLGALYVIGRFLHTPIHDRLYQVKFTAGSMFWVWLVALTLSQAIFNNKLKYWQRGLLYGIVLLTFYVAYVQASDWKSGWVPPLLVVAVLFGLRFPKLTVVAIPFGIFLAMYLTRDLIASDEYSWGTRVDAWMIVLEISRVSPILGMGFSNYYWYTPLFPIRGWSVNFNSHSQYVDIIAQTGLIGLLCFFWIFFETGLLSWKLSNRLPDGFGRSYAYGVMAGIAGTLMAAFLVDWVLPFVYNIGMNGFRASILPWIFFGGVVSLEQIIHKQGDR